MANMNQIEHVIVLMMENRSFDHMLGHLVPAADGGLVGDESCRDGGGSPVVVSANARYEISSPDHSHSGVMEQMSGNMGGFVTNYEKRAPGRGHRIMRCFDPRMLPVFSTLASEFMVCSNWFCSLPGETWPNREFAHTGTSRGKVNIDKWPPWSSSPTIFEQVDNGGNSWRIYHDDTAHTWVFKRLWKQVVRRKRFKGITQLYKDIQADALASYSFVEPDYGLAGWGNSQHPSQAHTRGEFAAGERLIHRIYNALRERQAVFAKTLFVITFDEHGGFFDHKKPPASVSPDGITANGFNFDTLGVRVPAIAISPWIKKNTIDPTVYDHTSIIKTVRERFCPGQPALTERDANASSMWSFWESHTLDAPRALPKTEELGNDHYAALELAYGARDAPPPFVPTTMALPSAMPGAFEDAMIELSRLVGEELVQDQTTFAGDVVPMAINEHSPSEVLALFRAST